MPTVGPADQETKALLERQFGNGSILFGQKRPSSSVKNSEQAQATSDEREDPAVSLQRAIEQRFGVQSTTENPHSLSQKQDPDGFFFGSARFDAMAI